MANNQGSKDQAGFWIKTIKGISGSLDVDKLEKDVIMLNRGILCDFANADKQVAMKQVYELANSIPPYSQTWDGVGQGDLYRTYQEIIDNIKLDVKDNDPKLKQQLDALMEKHATITNGAHKILRSCIQEYMQDYCAKQANAYECRIPLPGAPTMAEFLKTEYQPKFEALMADYDVKMDDIEQSIRSLRKKIYGNDVEQLDEAVRVLNYADPGNIAGVDMANRSEFLMKINDNGTVETKPRFTAGNLEDFKKWYSITKNDFDNNQKPSVEITLTNTDNKQSTTDWTMTENAIIPVDWFFQVSESVKVHYQSLEMSKYTFQASLSFQDVYIMDVAPSDSWYFENLLHTYNNAFVNDDTSIFKGKTINGPKGILPIRVKGLIIGVGESVKMEIDNWSSSDVKKQWDSHASFGIAFIHFANAGSKGHTHTHEVKENNNGFEVRDAHGIPRIIGALVEQY